MIQLFSAVHPRRSVYLLLATVLLAQLSGCGFFGGLKQPGGGGDGAPDVVLDNSKIKDAVPKVEPKSRGGNASSYTVFGKRYKVMDSARNFVERGDASWYGTKFHGRLTANGERYDMYKMTAAHKHLPLPTYVKVTNLDNGKQVIVRVNDRGPFHKGRIIDLSYAAASKIGILKHGTGRVEVEAIDAKAWQQARNNKPAKKPQMQSSATAISKVSGQTVNVNTATHRAATDSQVKRRYFQVAAYQNLAAAQSVQNRLLNAMQSMPERVNVVIHPTTQPKPLYRVRIGPLASNSLDAQLKQTAAQQSFGKLITVYE